MTKDVYSIHANLLYQPVEKVTVGGEAMFARRAPETGAPGDMMRLLLSAQYAF